MTRCNACNATGKVFGLYCGPKTSFTRTDTCKVCDGTGEITEEHHQQIVDGLWLKGQRLYLRESQRETAKRLGIDPVELSHMEQGRIPIPEEVKRNA